MKVALLSHTLFFSIFFYFDKGNQESSGGLEHSDLPSWMGGADGKRKRSSAGSDGDGAQAYEQAWRGLGGYRINGAQNGDSAGSNGRGQGLHGRY